VSVWVVPAGLRAMLRSYKNSHMSSLKPSIKVPSGLLLRELRESRQAVRARYGKHPLQKHQRAAEMIDSVTELVDLPVPFAAPTLQPAALRNSEQ
jgi:hypothetical protein